MSDKNYGLELYKLINDFPYVKEFGWISTGEFYVWVSHLWFDSFMTDLKNIFGYEIFDDGNFNANIQSDTVCINLNNVLDGYVDVEEVFPKDKYQY